MKPLALVVGALAAYVLVRVARDQRSAMRDFSAGGVTRTVNAAQFDSSVDPLMYRRVSPGSTADWRPRDWQTVSAYTAHGCAEVE